MSAGDYEFFDSMLPKGEFFSPGDLANFIGISVSHVEDSFYRCLLMGFASNQRFGALRSKVPELRIPRFAAVLWLIESSNFDGEMVLEQIEKITRSRLTAPQRTALSKRLKA